MGNQIASLNSREDLQALLEEREDGITSKNSQIRTLQKELVQAAEHMRTLEADLREHLNQINHECETLQRSGRVK